MDINPKVSVVIPTYNRADLIGDTINSVLNQTYHNFEIIVVDDGSTDNTRELIASFGCEIKYFYQGNTGLPAKARNKGIREATGEYIAFLDSDDKWTKDKLVKQIEIFDRFPKVDLIFTGIKIIDKRGNVLRRRKGGLLKENVLLSLLKKGNFITNSSVMVKKKALFGVGLLDDDKKIRGSEDFFLWIKLAVNHKFYSISKELTLYRKNEDSLCTSLSIRTVYDKIFLNKEIHCHIRKVRGQCLSRLHYELSRYYFSHQDFYKAKGEFFKAFFNYPGCLSWYLFFIMSLLSSGWLKRKIKYRISLYAVGNK